jgi:hypothetical protein
MASEQSQSRARRRMKGYMLDSENIATSVRVRPVGLWAWLKALIGIGVTHWFVTNQRLIQHYRFWGGYTFQDIPHAKVTSVEYGSKLPLSILGLGISFVLIGLGMVRYDAPKFGFVMFLIGGLVIIYAFYRRAQVLRVHGSGGTTFSLRITRGTQVDELILYLHAVRNEYTDR